MESLTLEAIDPSDKSVLPAALDKALPSGITERVPDLPVAPPAAADAVPLWGWIAMGFAGLGVLGVFITLATRRHHAPQIIMAPAPVAAPAAPAPAPAAPPQPQHLRRQPRNRRHSRSLRRPQRQEPVEPGSIPGDVVPNYLGRAIFFTICCFAPTAIVAIVYGARVNSNLNSGEIAEAQRRSTIAKRWLWASAGWAALLLMYQSCSIISGF